MDEVLDRTSSILILGGSGYLGKSLIKELETRKIAFGQIKHSMTHYEMKEIIVSNSPAFIVNLASTSGMASQEMSYQGNYVYPLSVLRLVTDNLGSKFKWIQIASYWELQIPFGRNTPYAIHKLMFRTELEEVSLKNGFLTCSLILPHIVGRDEHQLRLTQQLIKAKNSKTMINLSSGNQYLPILHITDSINAIMKTLTSHQILCSATPAWYGRLRTLSEKILGEELSYLLNFNESCKSPDADWLTVDFPEAIENFIPGYNLDMIIDDISKE